MTVSSISSSSSGWSNTVSPAHPHRPGTATWLEGSSESPSTGFHPPLPTDPLVPVLSFSIPLRLPYWAFAPYYKYVRSPRLLTLTLLLPMALVSACDRGAHPAQTGQAAPDFTEIGRASRRETASI